MGGVVSGWWQDPQRPPTSVLVVGALTAVAAGSFSGLLVNDAAPEGGAGAPTQVALASAELAATTSTTTTTLAVTTTRPVRVTVPPAPARAGEESENRWIAVLASVEAGASANEADARHATVQATVPDARRLESSQWPSLRPGYRVSYTGPFGSGSEVLSFCASRGLAVPDQCYGRYLSDNPADQSRIADG